MRLILAIAVAGMFAGCGQVTVTIGDSVSEEELEQFFRKHKVGRNHAVAMKKNTLGGVSYFGTVHGYLNNLSVCNQVIAPYNEDVSLSAIPGTYFCEELR